MNKQRVNRRRKVGERERYIRIRKYKLAFFSLFLFFFLFVFSFLPVEHGRDVTRGSAREREERDGERKL